MYNGEYFYLLMVRTPGFLGKYGSLFIELKKNFGFVNEPQEALNIVNDPSSQKYQKKGLLLVECCKPLATACPYIISGAELKKSSLDMLVVTSDEHKPEKCLYADKTGIKHIIDGEEALEFLEKHIKEHRDIYK